MLLLSFLSFIGYGYLITLGIVADMIEESLSGSSILLKGTQTGVITGFDVDDSLKRPDPSKIISHS